MYTAVYYHYILSYTYIISTVHHKTKGCHASSANHVPTSQKFYPRMTLQIQLHESLDIV